MGVEPMGDWGWRIVKMQSSRLASRRTFPSNNHNQVMGILLTDLCPIPVLSCMRGLPRDGGHAEFRATGAGEGACTWLPRSADGSLTFLLGWAFPDGRCTRGSTYARPFSSAQ